MKRTSLYGRALWFITGAASLCVGLGAMGFDVESMLHLASVSALLRYGVGLAGGLSLIMFAMSFSNDCSTGSC